MINSYLQGTSEQSDEAIHLLFSANRWEAAQHLLQDLKAGYSIVVDRYSFSGAVYSAAKGNAHLSLEWCWNPEIGLPQPDLVLFLDISTEDAAKRGGYGEERYEKVDMQVKVRHLFKTLFSRLPTVNVKTIDAAQSQQEVADQIWNEYMKVSKQSDPASQPVVLPALIDL